MAPPVAARPLRPAGHLGNGGSAYVLGDMFNGLQWHVYVADAHGADAAYEPPSGRPFHKFEVRRAFPLLGGGGSQRAG